MTTTCGKLSLTVWWVSLVGIHVGHTAWRKSNRAWLFWAERICSYICWYVWQFVMQSNVSWALHVVQVRCPITAVWSVLMQSSMRRTLYYNLYIATETTWALWKVKIDPTAIRVSSSRDASFLRTRVTDWYLLPISMTMWWVFLHVFVIQLCQHAWACAGLFKLPQNAQKAGYCCRRCPLLIFIVFVLK